MKKRLIFGIMIFMTALLSGCVNSLNDTEKGITGLIVTMDDEFQMGDKIQLNAEAIPSDISLGYNDFDVVFTDDMNGNVKYNGSWDFSYSGFGTFTFYLETEDGVKSNSFTVIINPNTISTEAELIDKMKNLKTSFKLTADINLSEAWIPIGTENSPFEGLIDGGGHTITGLDLTECENNCGFISFLGENGAIENLNFAEAKLESQNSGIVVGTNYGTLNNITVDGEIDVMFGDNVGGIAGGNYGIISNSINNINISTYGNNVGGIAGFSNTFMTPIDDEIVRVSLDNNVNNGDINGEDNVGGIFGKARPNTDTIYGGFHDTIAVMVIKNSVNNGTIQGNEAVGGLVGLGSGESIDQNNHTAMIGIISGVNNGDIIGNNYIGGAMGHGEYFAYEIIGFNNEGSITGEMYVGGVVGSAYGYYSKVMTIMNVTNNATVIGSAAVGGIAGEAQYIEDATNNGSITSTGTMYDETFENPVAFTGGIAGKAMAVRHSENNAIINVVTGGDVVGGIVGYLLGLDLSGNINNGNVSSNANFVGGIAGYTYMNFNITLEEKTFNLKDNENFGNVIGENYVGGIIGKLNAHMFKTGFASWSTVVGTPEFVVNLKDSINHGSITGIDYVGGIAGYAQGKRLYDGGREAYTYVGILGCLNDGDISGEDYVAGIIGGVEEDYFEYIRVCTNEGEINGTIIVNQIGFPLHLIENCVENGSINYN